MVSGSLSVNEGGESDSRSPFLTYTEQFYEAFPYYLSIGMTAEQFWDGDPYLAKYYRKADTLRVERENQYLWLQGMYIYDALCDVAPILQAMAKKGTKPHPYPEKPYSITENQRKREAEEQEKAIALKGKQMMEMLMKATSGQNKET